MSVLILQVVATLVIVWLVVRHIRLSRRRWEPEIWAHDMGLELTPGNEEFVRSYIERTRTLRTLGAILGFLAPIVYQALTDGPLPRPFDFGLLDALAGYLVGAVVAEVSFRRPNAPVRQASLVPRRLRDYLPHRLTIALRIVAAAALAVLAFYLALPASPGQEKDVILPPAAIMVPLILVIVVGVEVLQRSIVGRAQPAVQTDIALADDAIRSASVHALAGAGLALELLILGVELAAVATITDEEFLRWSLPWIGGLCFIAALRSWMHIARPDRWRVRRPVAGAVG